MSIQEGTRDPQAGTSDAPPGREMQVRQGAQGSLVEEAVWSTAPLPTDILLRPTGPRRGERCIPHYKSHFPEICISTLRFIPDIKVLGSPSFRWGSNGKCHIIVFFHI